MFNEWLNALLQFADSATSPTYESLWKLTGNLGSAASFLGALCAGGLAIWRFMRGNWRPAFIASVTAIAMSIVALLLYRAYKDKIDEDDWHLAQSVNSERSYTLYTQLHPHGRHSEQAKKQMASLHVTAPEPSDARPSPPLPSRTEHVEPPSKPKPAHTRLTHKDTLPQIPPDALKTFSLGGATIWFLGFDPKNITVRDGKMIAVEAAFHLCCNQNAYFGINPILEAPSNLWAALFSGECRWTSNDVVIPEASNPKLVRKFYFHGDCEDKQLVGLRFLMVPDPKYPLAQLTYDLPLEGLIKTMP